MGIIRTQQRARDIKSLQYLLTKKYFEAGDGRSAARKPVYEVQGTASKSSKANTENKNAFSSFPPRSSTWGWKWLCQSRWTKSSKELGFFSLGVYLTWAWVILKAIQLWYILHTCKNILLQSTSEGTREHEMEIGSKNSMVMSAFPRFKKM